MNDEVQVAGSDPDELRERAIRSLKKKAAFKKTLLVYLLVNALLVAIWALDDDGYFWPIWVIGGWGIGIAFQAYDAYGRSGALSEDQVAREMERLRGG
jgi:hypothetical protein